MITTSKAAYLMLLILSSTFVILPAQSHANIANRNNIQAQINDVQKLKSLWINYQDTLIVMDKALTSIIGSV